MTPHATRNKRPPLSVVVPIRDERETIRDLHRRLRDALPAETEIVLVDDGSRDGSREELARLASEDSRTLALHFLRPFGKSRALAAGFERCRGEVIATIDADLQEDPGEILKLRDRLRSGKRGGFDLVTGWRRRRRDPILKVLASRVFNALIRFLSGVALRDINCGLKVMRREVIEEIRLEGGYHRFIPLLAHWKGFDVGEEEITHAPRRHGRSRFGRERVLHGAVDLLVLLFLERFERRPSRLFLSVGALFFLTGLGICFFILFVWLTTTPHSINHHHPLMTLGVLLLVLGVQLISTGLLAELVARAHPGGARVEPRAFEVPPAEKIASSSGEDGGPSGVKPRKGGGRRRGEALVEAQPGQEEEK